MTGQPFTIRGAANDCWIVDRFISDAAQALWQASEDDWFDVLEAHWIVAYSEVSICPKVPYQFVLRCPPIVC